MLLKQVSSSTGDDKALAATHSSENWIMDSGATCHMCNNKMMFRELQNLSEPQEISLGDGHVLQAIAKGFIVLEMLLSDGSSQRCTL